MSLVRPFVFLPFPPAEVSKATNGEPTWGTENGGKTQEIEGSRPSKSIISLSLSLSVFASQWGQALLMLAQCMLGRIGLAAAADAAVVVVVVAVAAAVGVVVVVVVAVAAAAAVAVAVAFWSSSLSLSGCGPD